MADGLKFSVLALLLCLLSPAALAINKCTEADGKVTYQDAPCSAVSKTAVQVKTWENGGSRGVPVTEPNLKLEGPPQAKTLLDMYRRWADAERLALSTSRIALSGPVAALQALRRESEGLSVYQCVDEARKILVELVKKSSEGLLDFMAKDGLNGMEYTMVYRRKLVPDFEAAISKSRCN